MPLGLELLAPARDAATAREAILHGADAIYIGGPSHGARAAASNSVADIAVITEMAHRFGVRVYVTLNTIIYDSELAAVERTVHELYRAGVDALIVQDMALLRLDLPPIDLHASTQCDIRTPEKARFLVSCGFSQLVLPRELSADDIRAYRRAVPADVSLEAFVHGALCVSYSGDCQASYAACGRSANRGECAQMCRLPYSLTDSDGNVLIADKHLLSLRDLNRLADLHTLADAGITSFKIEGRLKDIAYVKTVTAAYRQALDRLIADHPDHYCRTSMGVSDIRFEPDVSKAFNRGFTSYFLQGRPEKQVSMANFDTPKFVGEKVATVVSCNRGVITARITRPLANGDGLGYFTPAGRYSGFRANRVEANRIYPASKVQIAPGTALYRNSDTAFEALMASDTATRKIPVDITLTGHDKHQHVGMHHGASAAVPPSGDGGGLLVTIRLSDDYGHMAEATIETERSQARTPQTDARRRTLAKLGDTDFVARDIDDRLGDDTFVPLSVLTALRRSATDSLADDIAATYPYRYRRPENPETHGPETITYHDNVANRLAADFYADHGAKVDKLLACTDEDRKDVGRKPANHALELQKRVPDGTVVMTTRYCLRRELGACLLTPDGRRLPSPLYLQNHSGRYRLDFDCARCQMHLITTK